MAKPNYPTGKPVIMVPGGKQIITNGYSGKPLPKVPTSAPQPSAQKPSPGSGK